MGIHGKLSVLVWALLVTWGCSRAPSSSLTTDSSNAEGNWRLRIKNPNPVPFRVRAEAGGSVVEKDVKNAPQPVEVEPEILEIKEAEWEKEDQQLEVEGKGTAGLVVLIANARTGERLATVTVDPEGKWRFKARLSSAPCRVLAECGSRSVEKAVENAPSGCR